MTRTSLALLAGLLLPAFLTSMAAADEIPWLSSIDEAKKLAVQTNRIVLVHFYSTSCPPCVRLEHEVYRKPGVAAIITAGFVPVKINVDHFPAVGQQYNVSYWPQDVVLTATGEVIEQRKCPPRRKEYLDGLVHVATAYHHRVSGPYSAIVPSGSALTGLAQGVGPTMSGPQAVSEAQATAASYLGDRYAGVLGAGQPASSVPTAAPPITAGVASVGPMPPAASRLFPGPQVTAPTSAVVPPPTVAPTLALEGSCPVELVEHERWVPGDRRWGAVHRGRLYLFSGEAQQRRFLGNPDTFSPAMAGNDPVLAIDRHQTAPGKREHGIFYKKRVFLFASEASLAQFSSNPERYVQATRQAELTSGPIRR